MYPSNYRYSAEHEWINAEGSTGVTGITVFAQRQLGDIVYAELPKPGERFAQGEPMGSLKSVKAIAEIYAIVSCEVLEVNDPLIADPEAINSDPHGKGWLLKIRLTDEPQLERLMSAEQYELYSKESSD